MVDQVCNVCGLSFATHGNDPDARCPVLCPVQLLPLKWPTPPATRWPDVCSCAVNGGNGVYRGIIHPQLDDCQPQPNDDCPVGTCHPLCQQVTGVDIYGYCNCACHG